MSGICGWVGRGVNPSAMEAMLESISYRGDKSESVILDNMALGYRWWQNRPGKSPGIWRAQNALAVCAGTLAPQVGDPAAELTRICTNDQQSLRSLDGAFAAAMWNAEANSLTLIRDPFGIRSLYYAERSGVFYFASELKQLLAISGFTIEPDLVAVHKYLTFSFAPGESVPVAGVKRILPGQIAEFKNGQLQLRPYFELRENIDERYADRHEATRYIREKFSTAVQNRWNGEKSVGVYLSGGIDSAGVALYLKKAGANVHALSLDFGTEGVEMDQAKAIAAHLNLELNLVEANPEKLTPLLPELAWKLDLPFGDPVTGPQYLLGRAARNAGLEVVFNGEGGDQLFGGWAVKPMIAGSVFSGLYEDDTREEMYLRSYHRFYGLEADLYTPEFARQVGNPGQRRAHLVPYLYHEEHPTFLGRLRLADISLKGSQNILPRAERMANAWGLDVRMPFFDRALAEASFMLPPQMKLHGATEKYILKRVLQKHLPRELVWRRKYGMSVPITQWLLRPPLNRIVTRLLSAESLAKRGLFRFAYVERLLAGQNDAHETRRRRIGERLWCLAMLELWFRIFIDGKGKQPREIV
ncbi:MAG: asparagine synthase-related protein [Turneriella sp.]